MRRDCLERQRVGRRGKKDFEHRSHFGGTQENGGELEEGRTEKVEQTGMWLLTMSRIGGSWVLAGSYRRAILVSPPHIAVSPPCLPGWLRRSGR